MTEEEARAWLADRLNELKEVGRTRLIEPGVAAAVFNLFGQQDEVRQEVLAGVLASTSHEVDQLLSVVLPGLDASYEYVNVGPFLGPLVLGLTVVAPVRTARALAGSAGVRRADARYSAVQWWWASVSTSAFVLPAPLHGALLTAVAARLSDVQAVVREQVRMGIRSVGCSNSPILNTGWALELRRLTDRFDTAARAGALSELRDAIERHGEELTPMVPWLLAWADPDDLAFLSELVLSVPSALQELRELAAPGRHGRVIRMRARAMLGSAADDNSGPAQALLSVARWAVDTGTFQVPTQLAAPTSIWTDDRGLEDAIRNAANAAVDAMRTGAMTNEDLMTGALIALLTTHLDGVAGHDVATTHGELSLGYVTTTGRAEKGNGVDLALLLDVGTDMVVTRRAHLVQIKRVDSLEGAGGPRWRIDVEQLTKLLAHDPTASYWLIGPPGGTAVMCVPAAYLLARARGASRQPRRTGPDWALPLTVTVRYETVRSAAIPLGQLLCDLVVGLWVGSEGERALDVADGLDSSYLPDYLMQLRVGAGAT